MPSSTSTPILSVKINSTRQRRSTVGVLDDWNLSSRNQMIYGVSIERELQINLLDERESIESYLLNGMRRDSIGTTTTTRLSKQQHKRSKSESWTKLAQEQLVRTESSLFGVDLDYTSNSGSDDSFSLPSTPTTGPSTPTSNRSSPSPSEYDFDSSSSSTTTTTSSSTTRKAMESPLSKWNVDKSGMVLQQLTSTTTTLKRRHTVPERRRRAPSISFTIVTPELSPISSNSFPFFTTTSTLPLPTFTFIIASLTLSLSLLSLISPIPLLPASPVHLLRGRIHHNLEYLNALLAPFLITLSSSTSILFGIANITSLKSIDDNSSKFKLRTKVGIVGFLWCSILLIRCLLCWVFGRVLGWAHPELFSTQAIHEVGAGLAPLLLSLQLIQTTTSSRPPHFLQIAMLATNFFTPIEYGGSGLWWGISSIIVGLVTSFFIITYRMIMSPSSSSTSSKTSSTRRSSSPSKKRRTTSNSISYFNLLALLLLPLLSKFSTTSTSTTTTTIESIANRFSNLHPNQSKLVTVLLLTAPRPGNPDYLFQTIQSWLGALPSPSTTTTTTTTGDRIKVIVYTHFETHQVFDAAQNFFSTSPLFKEKNDQYLEWYRDPRAIGGENRLDQRLHVARGLDYATTTTSTTSDEDDQSAYVLLTEDDFPLCPNKAEGGEEETQKWDQTWEELMRLFVDTNQLMPDSTSLSSLSPQVEQVGHCGIFFSTGGSGLAIRTPIASLLPSLLLGSEDSKGTRRDYLASIGEIVVPKEEGPDSDTPDVVIQDCLRGLLPGCEMCSPPPPSSTSSSSSLSFKEGSKRNREGLKGSRWGKSGLVSTERLLQHHLGFNASTLPGRKYGKEEWQCGWRSALNGEPDVYII